MPLCQYCGFCRKLRGPQLTVAVAFYDSLFFARIAVPQNCTGRNITIGWGPQRYDRRLSAGRSPN